VRSLRLGRRKMLSEAGEVGDKTVAEHESSKEESRKGV
jgi:hypothetical protein